MPMGVFDFPSIARKLNCQEQKADFEEKNPKPVETAPVVWSFEYGYGVAPVTSSYTPPDWLPCAPTLGDVLARAGVKI